MEKIGDSAGQALDVLLKPAACLIRAVESQAAAGSLLKKVGYGLIGAAYACVALTVALAVAVAIGVGTVRVWVEEPVVVRESLHFDYTEFRPEAVFSFGGGLKGLPPAVPVGHTYYVALALVLPDSDYNRHVGVFQLTGEVLSTNGTLMARSSQPCMLRFHSRPIRLARIFLMGIPILLGTSLEAQKLSVDLLRYHEAGKCSRRTGSIRIMMSPRAGAGAGGLPELYESQILVRSQLPWHKELVRSWKWTFYVWASLYVYVALLVLVLCCFRPLVFLGRSWAGETGGERANGEGRGAEEMDAETLRKWQQYRRKRKAEVLGRLLPVESTTVGSSAMSYTVTKDEGGGSGGGWGWEVEDDVDDITDSSSVCS